MASKGSSSSLSCLLHLSRAALNQGSQTGTVKAGKGEPGVPKRSESRLQLFNVPPGCSAYSPPASQEGMPRGEYSLSD